MKWMRERDLLIAQTMAFVQSVTGRKPDAEIFARTELTVTTTRLPDVEAMLAEGITPAEAPRPATPKILSAQPVTAQSLTAQPVAAQPVALAAAPPPRGATRSEYRSEIQARVEKFRAHQARFSRDREAYCSATMAKVQAALDKYPVPRPK